MSPRGTIGMGHLTHDGYQQLGTPPFADLMVLASPYPTTELVPSLLLVDHSGIQVLAECG